MIRILFLMACFLVATAKAAQREEIIYGPCYEYAPFKKNNFLRKQKGKDTFIYYDLLYRIKEKVRIVIISHSGHIILDEIIHRVLKLDHERFEVNENDGDEISLSPQIKGYIEAHEFQTCK